MRLDKYESFSEFFVKNGSIIFPALLASIFGLVVAGKFKQHLNVTSEDLQDAASELYDNFDSISDVWDAASDLFDWNFDGWDLDIFDGWDGCLDGCDGCDGCGLDGCF